MNLTELRFNFFVRFANLVHFNKMTKFSSRFFYFLLLLHFLIQIIVEQTNNNIILNVKNLCVSFKHEKQWKEILHEISFCIKKGEVLGLVGESGSGKSVTSMAIMGLLDKKISKINGGEIHFYGKNKAMIFQEPMTALNPVKRCGEQVDEMILIHEKISKKQARQRTLALFKEVLLPDVERCYNSYPFELSGGQRQRVMIAMAISCNPELLIADEPTTALDVTVQKTILELLNKIRKEHNMSVLFISHDLGVVHKIADKIAVIYHGKLVEINTSENIFLHPQDIYTKSLIASRPPLDYKPDRLLTIQDFMQNKDTSIRKITDEEIKTHNKELYKGEPLLKVDNLGVDYIIKRNFLGKVTKKFHAINNIELKVYKGETLGLVGESGCGKTTVGRAITRLIDISSGTISFEGKKISEMTSKEKHQLRKDIQIIFQDPYSSLNPRKSIGQTIEEPMEVFNICNAKQRKERTIEILQKTGLSEEYYNRYPHELSGGQRQRVGIARALSLSPKLIICDESVSALDVSVQAQVLNLLNELKKDFGFAYIFISHDLSVVKYMSDRIIVMQKGNIVEEGLSADVYNQPKSEYTKKLIDAIPK